MPSIRGFWQQWVFTDLPLYFNITKFHRSFNARRQTTLCMLCTAEVNMAYAPLSNRSVTVDRNILL